MHHSIHSFKTILGSCALMLTSLSVRAQFVETMGTTGSSPETIAARETANRFDQISHTYSGTSDARNTTPSTGYAGASGGFNILIQAQETFVISGINASRCGTADSLSFGVFKSTNASTGVDYLVLEYSINGGTSWVNLPFTALPTGSGTSVWYKRKIALPAAAQISGLTLRFRSTLTGTSSAVPQFRIDDVAITCGTSSSSDCSNLTSLVESEHQTVYCADLGTNDLTATTNMTAPTYQWYNQNGAITGQTGDILTVNASGTYYVKISNAAGCNLTSAKTYILIYPQPEFCTTPVSGCTGDTVQACVSLKSNGLIISEYVEGTGNNKYLEIFNGTCDSINLANYAIRAYHNGVTSPTFTIPLSGMLAAGDVFVIANPSATAWSGTPDLITANLSFNGNDAVVLYNTATATIVDIFGVIGIDPGTAWKDETAGSPTLGWTTENKTLVRKSCVYSGITTNTGLTGIGGFATLTTEWDTLSVNTVSGLGSHVFGASAYTFNVASGNAVVASSNANCALIVVGNGAATVAVDATFCTFDDCAETNNLIVVNDTCMKSRQAVAEVTVSDAVLYPNPFNDNLTLTFGEFVEGSVTVVFTQADGQTALKLQTELSEGTSRVEMDVNSLKPGAYICTVATSARTYNFRVVKTN